MFGLVLLCRTPWSADTSSSSSILTPQLPTCESVTSAISEEDPVSSLLTVRIEVPRTLQERCDIPLSKVLASKISLSKTNCRYVILEKPKTQPKCYFSKIPYLPLRVKIFQKFSYYISWKGWVIVEMLWVGPCLFY